MTPERREEIVKLVTNHDRLPEYKQLRDALCECINGLYRLDELEAEIFDANERLKKLLQKPKL